MKQTKVRIAEIEGRLSATFDHIDRQQQLQLLSSRLAELSAHLGPHIIETLNLHQIAVARLSDWRRTT